MGEVRLRRLPVLALGMLSLLVALWAGLGRIGWALPQPREALPTVHGPLMMCGFLGTLIALERAVAVGSAWAYLSPIAAGLSGVALAVGLPLPAAQGLAVAAGVLLVVAYGVFLRRQPSSHMVVMTIGGACWAVGNGLWLAGVDLLHVAPWWSAFLVLTIAAERLELSRLAQPRRSAKAAFLAIVAIYLGGVAATLVRADAGARVEGAGALLLALWLARYDIARRTVRGTGLPRYVAVCLLTGYVWLAAHGGMLLAFGDAPPGTHRDATLHALFLGFVMAMIFGHAPVIFPAILGVPVPYRASFYLQLVLLHASLAVRVAGDILLDIPLRQWGGLANGLAILAFLLNTLLSVAAPPPPATLPAR